MSFGFDMFLFLLLKGDTQANPWIFSDSAQSWTNNSKNSGILPGTFYVLVTNGVRKKALKAGNKQNSIKATICNPSELIVKSCHRDIAIN